MIRQPRRSTAASVAASCCAADRSGRAAATAAALATRQRESNTRSQFGKSKNSIKVALILLVGALLWRQCGAWPSRYEEDAVAVGSSSHEPKFGERLLPLRKKSSASLKFGAIVKNTTATKTAAATATTATTTNASAATKSHHQQREPKASASENNNNNYYKNNSNSNNNLNPDVLTVVPLDDSQITRRRQGKQLRRRQDLNVAEVLELAEQPPAEESLESQPQPQPLHPADASTHPVASNASSLKADRFIEMSTEFFIVPTSSAPSVSSSSTGGVNSGAAATTARNPAKARNSVKSSRGVSHGVAGGGIGVGVGVSHGVGGGGRSVLVVAPRSGTTNTHANPNLNSSAPSVLGGQLHGGLRREPWVVPVLVLAALTMLMMAAFEIFVLFKAWRTSPSRRHLFLGQMLLLGLFACAGLGALLTAQPTLLSCGTLRFGIGVAYALVFAALLVKCVFLISLNGGVYLPAPYQGLLLLFAVLIQVAIGAQWLLTAPPELYTLSVPIATSSGGVFASASISSSSASLSSNSAAFARVFHAASGSSTSSSSSSSSSSSPTPAELYTHSANLAGGTLIPLCKTQFSELLFSLIYIVFLIVFVSVLAIKSRGIRDNYREATYIGLAIGGAIPIWLGWILCGLAVAERHKDACIAFGLVATSATVFLVMFMPKGRQLAAMGKEGLYVEDREEQFSSLSRAGSGYSPSFFHFKPIKYGVMGGLQNSTATNTGNATSMKLCSNGLSGGGGGDRVALVAAAPPSYTRMYHYFPAHLTHPFCFYPQPPPPPPAPLQHVTQLAPVPPPPPTLKQLGNSITSMTHAHIAQTLRYPGLFIRPDETNLYTTLEPTLSSNPNVYFQRGNAVHPGMMY